PSGGWTGVRPAESVSPMKRFLMALCATSAVALALGPATAGAASPTAKAYTTGPAILNGDGTATVPATYKCSGPADLFVSIKQVASRTKDPILEQDGSSQFAAGWWFAHPTTLVCDGTWRTQGFLISTDAYGFGVLEPGQGWLQFCISYSPDAHTTHLL